MDKCPVCGRAHMIIDPEAPGATAQVLGNFPPQVDMGSLLAGFLSFDIRLGWHLQALPPEGSSVAVDCEYLYSQFQQVSAFCHHFCSLWSLGGQDFTPLTLSSLKLGCWVGTRGLKCQQALHL